MGELPVFDDAALGRLAMPVHVLVGRDDVMVDSAQTKRRLEAAAADPTVRLLPGIGRFIPPHTALEREFLIGGRQERSAESDPDVPGV